MPNHVTIVEREVTVDEITIVDGVAVLARVAKTEVEQEFIYDEFPMFDSNGSPVMIVTGKGIAVQRIHRVPVMEEYQDSVELSPAYSKANVRSHFGFIAQDIEAALVDMGKTSADFAGLIIDKESGILGLRYEQVLSILWPVVKDLVARIDALDDGKIG